MNLLFDLLTFSRFHHFRASLCSIGLMIGLICGFGLVGCQSQPQAIPIATTAPIIKANLSEVTPPIALEELNEWFDQYQPHVEVLSPRPNEVLPDTQVSLKLAVKGLPIFRDLTTGLGPYLQVTLDNQASRPVYSVDQPVIIEDLAPGTHTLRIVAVRPWGESFKTAGAYAQVTFHTLVESDQNNPSPQRPLLTYNQPQGFYGSEPFLLDFYLANAPLPSALKNRDLDGFSEWQVRCTINGTSFTVDRWQAFYLTGLKAGKNWVRLELLDGQGRLIENEFNPTTWVVQYQPGGEDARSRLLRGELTATEVRGALSPKFESVLPPVIAPEAPPSIPPASPEPVPSISEKMLKPEVPTLTIESEPSVPPVAQPESSPALEPSLVTPDEPKTQATQDVPVPPKGSTRSWRNFLRPQPQSPENSPGQAEESPSQSLAQPEETQEIEDSTSEIERIELLPSSEPELETPILDTAVDSVTKPEPGKELEPLKKRWQNYLSRPQSAPKPPDTAPELEPSLEPESTTD